MAARRALQARGRLQAEAAADLSAVWLERAGGGQTAVAALAALAAFVCFHVRRLPRWLLTEASPPL